MTNNEQAQVMAWLARLTKSRVIVEAGTYYGATTKVLASANPYATVYTADPYTSPRFKETNVVFHQGDFLEMLDIYGLDQIDFAYIDATPIEEHGTEHSYRYRYRCGMECAKRATPNGIICFDDTNPAPWKKPFRELEQIKEMCQLNIKALKGFSVWYKEEE